jgi:allophanate hydrolase subunit 2
MEVKLFQVYGELTALEESRGPGARHLGIAPGGAFARDCAEVAAALLPQGESYELANGSAQLLAGESLSVAVVGAGGFQGRRTLRQGEALRLGPTHPGFRLVFRVGPPFGADLELAALPSSVEDLNATPRVLPFVPAQGLHAEGVWKVTHDTNRAAIKLSGKRLGYPGEGRSRPCTFGSIQLLPSGDLLVHGPDGPTVGGYPVAGTIVSTRLPHLAQAAPGTEIELVPVTLDEALTMAREDQLQLRRLTTQLRLIN